MGTKAIWRIVGTISLLATLLFLAGFGYAVNDMLFPRDSIFAPARTADDTPAHQPKEGYRIVALGDSLTQGTGDDTGEGYVKKTVRLLKDKTGKPVTLINNLGVGGLRADQLADTLADNRSYADAIRQANLILLTIGGNDLFRSARGVLNTPQGLETELAGEFVNEGLGRLDRILTKLHAINPDARIIYVGLYNPFYGVPELRAGSETVQAWNGGAYRLLSRYPGATLVPTYDLFEQTIEQYLSGDSFHPNGAGYAAIAQRIVQSIE
jgi:lysophospholipase L1-like esterase